MNSWVSWIHVFHLYPYWHVQESQGIILELNFSASVWSKTQQKPSDWSHSIVSTCEHRTLTPGRKRKEQVRCQPFWVNQFNSVLVLYIPDYRVRGKCVWPGYRALLNCFSLALLPDGYKTQWHVLGSVWKFCGKHKTIPLLPPCGCDFMAKF